MIPKVTYAAVIWWSRIEAALARTELQHLQRAGCIMVPGAITSTKVLEMLLDLPIRSTVLEPAALTATHRLLRPNQRAMQTG